MGWLTSRERGALFVVNVDGEGAALLALGFRVSSHSGCTLADSNGEVAGVTFEAPSFFLVILEAEVALEALDAKVNE